MCVAYDWPGGTSIGLSMGPAASVLMESEEPRFDHCQGHGGGMAAARVAGLVPSPEDARLMEPHHEPAEAGEPTSSAVPPREHRCIHCASSLPAAATYCLKCERSQSFEWNGVRSWLGTLASLLIPLAIVYASHDLEASREREARKAAALEREARLSAQLSEAVSGVVRFHESVSESLWKLARACEPYGQEEGPCRDRFFEALHELDAVFGRLGWNLDSLPVSADSTHAITRFRQSYFGYTDDEQSRSLRKSLTDRYFGDQLFACPGVRGPESRACRDSINAMRREEIRQIRSGANFLTCHLIEDANEMRIKAWEAMAELEGVDRSNDFYEALAATLTAASENSLCERIRSEGW